MLEGLHAQEGNGERMKSREVLEALQGLKDAISILDRVEKENSTSRSTAWGSLGKTIRQAEQHLSKFKRLVSFMAAEDKKQEGERKKFLDHDF